MNEKRQFVVEVMRTVPQYVHVAVVAASEAEAVELVKEGMLDGALLGIEWKEGEMTEQDAERFVGCVPGLGVNDATHILDVSRQFHWRPHPGGEDDGR